MLVIVEGPDGAGKSTLARAVQAATGCEYRHAGAPMSHPLVEYTYGLQGRDVVLDRFHLGELVYGPLYRGKAGLTPEQVVAVEQYLASLGAIVVYCSGPLATLLSRLMARGESPHPGRLMQELTAWDAVIAKTSLPVLHSPVGLEVTAAEVITFAAKQEVAA